MSQLGGDVRFWRRRFFTLRGWRLFSSSDASSRPRVVIDLSLAVVLATHNQIILQQDNDLRLSLEECLAPTSVKNGFRIVFNTGEVIDYFCDTAKEKGRWLDVLRVVIEKIPEWPQWMERDDDDDMFTDDNSLQLATTWRKNSCMNISFVTSNLCEALVYFSLPVFILIYGCQVAQCLFTYCNHLKWISKSFVIFFSRIILFSYILQ